MLEKLNELLDKVEELTEKCDPSMPMNMLTTINFIGATNESFKNKGIFFNSIPSLERLEESARNFGRGCRRNITVREL